MKFLPLLLLCFCFTSCRERDAYKTQAQSPQYLFRAYNQLNHVIIHDIFSPPVASRIYAYSSLAAYEALLPQHPEYQSMDGQFYGYGETPQPASGEMYCYPLASAKAFMEVAKTLTFSADMYEDFEKKFFQEFRDMMPPDVFERSVHYGEIVATHVMEFAKKDKYKQTRGFRYTVTNLSGTWVPTPPGYMDGVEPQWFKIRPFTLDSATQFTPPPPPPFSLDKKTDYYKYLSESYETGKNLTAEQKTIANFWDCNPFKLNITGHAMFATKKLSPGGHWIGITGQAARKAKADLMKTTETYLLVSLGLFDGFLSCWTEKYHSNAVRPETIINQYLDKDWVPLLQTPPFPEYTSGHSVCSAATAEILTHQFGDNFAYTDSTEVSYGLGMRSYTSFRQAAQEASISRLYGGIHFRPALENGYAQGKKVGEWVLGNVKTRKSPVAGR
jgi:hypothetical protein